MDIDKEGSAQTVIESHNQTNFKQKLDPNFFLFSPLQSIRSLPNQFMSFSPSNGFSSVTTCPNPCGIGQQLSIQCRGNACNYYDASTNHGIFGSISGGCGCELTPTAVFGIAVGSFAFAIIVVVLIVEIWRRRRRSRAERERIAEASSMLTARDAFLQLFPAREHPIRVGGDATVAVSIGTREPYDPVHKEETMMTSVVGCVVLSSNTAMMLPPTSTCHEAEEDISQSELALPLYFGGGHYTTSTTAMMDDPNDP